MKRLTSSFIRRWQKALRSGKYQQTRGALFGSVYDEDSDPTGDTGYCCLGVAGSLLGLSDEEMIRQGLPIDVSSCEVYPSELLHDCQHSLVSTLAEMNDDGNTFNEIADFMDTQEFKELVKQDRVK